MEFCILTADEYRKFLEGNPQASFMQTVELSKLIKEYGSKVHFVGVKQDGILVAGSMILEDKTILNQSQFYAPRGLIVDYHNKELLLDVRQLKAITLLRVLTLEKHTDEECSNTRPTPIRCIQAE